ncbi:Ppx/GppA family phosphatase [Paenibacillus oralis]|uniref:Ppx/GppA family phosphatase n=1 Tax=Paenibacillus oralis TaxID=2490856 RepID=A0A3P3U9Q2_9BACL|nr:Ppx/GppA phosphatase family protein [Paenibacillus oralis]RRJ67030.1 Ppx/GppA family phosphatase [Paenibacillus oralis]
MENSRMTIGIIDIGSNSIRLAIYEATPQGEYRLVQEIKESARLSEKMNAGGAMERKDVLSIVPILEQFREICAVYGCRQIRVAATAAIRNAANAREIAELLKERTGLEIEILTGEQEAYFGFLGVAGAMAEEDGFIIDIGGGSTEITLFRARKLLHSFSLPLGAVNAQVRFGNGKEPWTAENTASLAAEIERMLSGHPWVSAHPGLPLIGLGGTIRTLGKLDQRRRKYPLRLAHYYRLAPESIRHYAETLPFMPLEKRKRLDGLAKARTDIIAPGLIILQAIFARIGADCCLVSGSGLREGLLQDALGLKAPAASEVLARQAQGLLAFHIQAPHAHFQQVSRYAIRLHDLLLGATVGEPKTRQLAAAAAMLYKIGGTVRYHQYDKHTLYWLTQAPLGALTHREAVICGYVADYPANHGKKMNLGIYRELLTEEDETLIQKLGAIVETAVALDASETQCVELLKAEAADGALLLTLKSRSQAYLEIRQLEAAAKNFKKAWDLRLEWEVRPSSTR